HWSSPIIFLLAFFRPITGQSISIPCLYDSQYENYLKYLCKGYYYRECKYAVKTNQPDQSGKYSISDDKKQRIFTVTIKNLNAAQDSHYWCAVEIPGIWEDVRVYFHLGSLTALIISLTLLIFFVTVSLVIWFLLKRSSKFTRSPLMKPSHFESKFLFLFQNGPKENHQARHWYDMLIHFELIFFII
uniref:Immunoglobulin V-set domain-containing protein n=1 Tax=Oreochromis aureus TaxID=47969 RepID=A0A668SZD5_OREAU